ncbi:MAG: transketolase family protein [Armatimonadetes bacterium]|nr:transketolase family protein [Armatimonadota bacterium]
MAKSFPEVILELAHGDARICGVSCDCWGFLGPLAAEFPERAVEVGIAEQNLIGVAAGLAARGKIPFAIGMNPFVTMRCFEHIRTDLGYGGRNVKVVGGYSGGVMYAGWGCTHHAMEEIALMRLVPGMTVFFPADAFDTEQAVRAAARIEGPCYISLTGGTLETGQPESDRAFEAGKASLLRDGRDVALIGTGPAVQELLKAARLLAAKGISARILNMHTVKPLDREAVLRAAAETDLIVTLEEHTVIGGLGGAVAETLAEAGVPTPLRRLGLQDAFACMVGSYEDVKARFGLDAAAVVKTVAEQK